MLELFREVTINQYLATLATLENCIQECPADAWEAPVGNHAFDQVVFHTLFYGDVYLSVDVASAKAQEFHSEHSDQFSGYEEMENRPPERHYDRDFLLAYLEHCRGKARSVMDAETEESLAVRPGFDWQSFSRAELHTYNIRHIHHHVAQLSLCLRRDHGIGINWVRSG